MHLLDKLKRKPKANESKAVPLPNWATTPTKDLASCPLGLDALRRQEIEDA